MRTPSPPARRPRASSRLNWHSAQPDYPAIADIKKYVVDKGKSQVENKELVGNLLYNRGVYNGVLIAEGIANAQKVTGKKMVTGEDVRRGLETLNLDAARLKALGLTGFTGPIKLSCTDHNGHRPAFVQQWDGAKWTKISDLIEPMSDKVEPLLVASAKAFTEKNAPWPARTEICDAK